MLYEDEDASGQTPAEPSSASPSENSASLEQNSLQSTSPPPIFHPLAYRAVVANWPIDWREQWGRRANSLGRKWAVLAGCGNPGVCGSLEPGPQPVCWTTERIDDARREP